MGATSGTRRGNGAGWGGPAKGAGRDDAKITMFQPGNPGDPSRWPMTDKRKRREEEADEVLDRLRDTALGKVPVEVKPVEVQAMVAFTNRVLGTPRQTVDSNVKVQTLGQLVEASLADTPEAPGDE